MSTYGMKDAANIMIVKRGTKTPILKADYANTTSAEWKSDRVYAKKKGANAIAWDSARTGTLTIDTELFDLKLLALVAGDELHQGASEIFKNEKYKLTSDHLISLKYKPLDGSVSVFKLKDDGITHDQTIPQLMDGEAGSVPPMVTDVSVSAKDTSAEITWSAAKGAVSYVVYRDGIQIGQPVTNSFSDSDLTPQKQYKYTVTAVNTNGASAKSAEVIITTAAKGTDTAGEAVKATGDAIKQAEANAKVVSANGVNFKINDSGNIQLSEACPTGAQYVVYYAAQVDGVSEFTVNAVKFADNFEIYADCTIRDQQKGQDHFAQIHYTNAKPEGSFTIGQDATKATSLSLKFDLMPDEDNVMATYKFIEEDVSDVAV